jgi:agmatinase
MAMKGLRMDPDATHGLWADLHVAGITPDEADFTIIGIPYDGAASSRKGARLAPERIRYWSRHMTPFSETVLLANIRVCDLGDMP